MTVQISFIHAIQSEWDGKVYDVYTAFHYRESEIVISIMDGLIYIKWEEMTVDSLSRLPVNCG